MSDNDSIIDSLPQSRVEKYLRAAILKDKSSIPLPEARIDYYLLALIDAIIEGAGAKSHTDLTNRDVPDQHPISAITGLAEVLANMPKAKIWNNISEMIGALNLEDMERTSDYFVGQSFLIKTLEVPDIWITSISDTHNYYTYQSDEKFVEDLRAAGTSGLHVGWYVFLPLEGDHPTLVDFNNYKAQVQYNFDSLYAHKFADSATAGQVLTADGEGGASYENLPDMSAGISKIVTIPVSAWEPVTGGYEAEITIEGVTADNSVIVEGDVKAVRQATNSLTFFSEEIVSTDQIVKVIVVNTIDTTYEFTQSGSELTLINAPYKQNGSEVTII